jgi:excisionase family DNA binding protein
MMGEKWLTVKEAAALWRVTPWTIRAWIHKGTVTGVKFGHRTLRVLVVTEDAEGEGRGPDGSVPEGG